MAQSLGKQIGVAADRAVDHAIDAGRRVWVAVAVLSGGILLGSQIFSPNKRVIQVIAAAVLVVSALRVQTVIGLMIMIPLLPFPKATTYGSTNVAFVLILFTIWMARVVLRVEKTAGRSPIDIAVALLVAAYALSFSQIDDYSVMYEAFTNTFLALTYIAICYLAIHLIHTEQDFRRVIWAVVGMAVLVQFTALFELAFPARPLVPGWIELGYGNRLDAMMEGLEIKNMRLGGAFNDYELLAEFCAMMILLQWFLLMQTKGNWVRAGVLALIGLSCFVLLATVTRGAIISLIIASAYLLWMTKHRIKFHTAVLTTAGMVTAGFLILNVVSSHTRSGNVFERMAETTFSETGIPDTRQLVWADAWERVWDSPVFGHGPYFSHRSGVRQFFWPHCNYLFYWHIIGIVGLGAFLLMLFQLWRASRFHSSHLGSDSFAGGFLLVGRAILILFIVDQIKIDYIRNTIYPYWIWLFFGLLVAAGRIAKQQMDEEEEIESGPVRAVPTRRISAVSDSAAVMSATRPR